MPDPLSAIAGLVGGGISAIAGISQKAKGNKLLKGLQYPTETIPDEYISNQNLAQQMAATGMPSEQYNMAMRNIQRQQLQALRGATDRRGGLAILPQLLQGTNDATLNLDAANAQQRIANQRNLMNVNNQVAGVRRDIFDKNVRQKYMNDYNYAMSLKGMGNQNLFGGIDKLAAGTVGLFGSKKNNTAGADGTGGY